MTLVNFHIPFGFKKSKKIIFNIYTGCTAQLGQAVTLVHWKIWKRLDKIKSYLTKHSLNQIIILT